MAGSLKSLAFCVLLATSGIAQALTIEFAADAQSKGWSDKEVSMQGFCRNDDGKGNLPALKFSGLSPVEKSVEVILRTSPTVWRKAMPINR